MPKVMLDAGHYGSRNQSPVYPQYYEAKQMWKLHLYLKKHLENFGFDVLMTRSNQATDMSVAERGSLAKGCDLFLSLHSDASDSAIVDRATVFYAYDDFNHASALAKQIAHAVGLCMGVSGTIKTRQGNNGDYYGVMRGARSAGCPLYYIIEHSFHTCKKSAEWLMSDSHLDKLAKAEAEVIAAYYGLKKEETEKTETTNKGASTVNIELTVLRKGSEGEEVKTLQRLLLALGYEMKSASGKKYGADGDFGGATEAAVKAFQRAKGLEDDGIVGKNTWNKLLRG